VARLAGGVGNQMFQYAFARTLADRHSAPLILDARKLDVAGTRQYGLDKFAVRVDWVERSKPWRRPRTRLGARWQSRQVARQELPPLLQLPARREETFAFAPDASAVTPPVELQGFWQSYKYFAENRQAIQRDLALLDRTSSGSDVVAMAEPYAAIHVRRGDFALRRHHTRHPMMALEYYQRAREHLSLFVDASRIVAISDDPGWVSSELKIPCLSQPSSGWVEDFAQLREAAAIAISNSTFSWWAAWLSRAKCVVAPQRWSQDLPDADLIPPTWIRL
jgi:hypothetical protein